MDPEPMPDDQYGRTVTRELLDSGLVRYRVDGHGTTFDVDVGIDVAVDDVYYTINSLAPAE